MEVVASLPSHLALSEVGAMARRIEELGFDVLHVPETIHDPFTVSALAVTHTSRLVVRTSMVLAFPRSPMLTAYAAWDLAKLSGGRFQLGIASQVRGNIVGRFSTPWTDPVAQLGDYIGSLRAIFDCFQNGGALDYEGSHYRFTRLQPYFNPGPMEHPAPEIWMGGVNRGMTMLAGRLADGFVSHPTSSHPRMLETGTLPVLDEGAAAGRRSGRPKVVAGPQPLMAATQAELVATRDRRRPELAFLYSTPAYRRQLEVFGLEDLGSRLSAMAQQRDWDDLPSHLTDEVIGALLPQGTYDEIPSVLTSWYAGLCDGLVLAVPELSDADEEFRAMVVRCREISGAARHPSGDEGQRDS
jgi:probable F420-dependent oxidoreductase